MVTDLLGGYALGKIMADLKMLPEECADVRFEIPVDGLLRLVYTVNVMPADLLKWAEAFRRLHEEQEARVLERKQRGGE